MRKDSLIHKKASKKARRATAPAFSFRRQGLDVGEPGGRATMALLTLFKDGLASPAAISHN
jgi:hypothetical protein